MRKTKGGGWLRPSRLKILSVMLLAGLTACQVTGASRAVAPNAPPAGVGRIGAVPVAAGWNGGFVATSDARPAEAAARVLARRRQCRRCRRRRPVHAECRGAAVLGHWRRRLHDDPPGRQGRTVVIDLRETAPAAADPRDVHRHGRNTDALRAGLDQRRRRRCAGGAAGHRAGACPVGHDLAGRRPGAGDRRRGRRHRRRSIDWRRMPERQRLQSECGGRCLGRGAAGLPCGRRCRHLRPPAGDGRGLGAARSGAHLPPDRGARCRRSLRLRRPFGSGARTGDDAAGGTRRTRRSRSGPDDLRRPCGLSAGGSRSGGGDLSRLARPCSTAAVVRRVDR